MLRLFKRHARRALRLASAAYALARLVAALAIDPPRAFVAEPWSSLRSPTREQFVAANVAGAW